MEKTLRINNMDMAAAMRSGPLFLAGATSRKRTWGDRCRHCVEWTSWDETLIRQERWIDPLCWVAVGMAVLYFMPTCLAIFRS